MYSKYEYLNPPDNLKVFDDYMNGTIEGNVEKLSSLISDLLLE